MAWKNHITADSNRTRQDYSYTWGSILSGIQMSAEKIKNKLALSLSLTLDSVHWNLFQLRDKLRPCLANLSYVSRKIHNSYYTYNMICYTKDQATHDEF